MRRIREMRTYVGKQSHIEYCDKGRVQVESKTKYVEPIENGG